MSTTSLFRKWRSQTFEDLVGQTAVVRTLRNALQSGSPARAYLFCGPRGTGKTSTARIFAKALNCRNGPTPDPCGECTACRRIAEGSCLDVLEIDAASHTQVDKVREFIVDKVHFAPAEVRFKVYIIDEVHKLSTSSFNALLKTLEEPPPHVVFILATTHPHELLPTILSRCQRHDFLRLSPAEIQQQLLRVAGAESIGLSEGAAALLARPAEGSLRDALVQLEQVATFAGQRVEEEDLRALLGLAGPAAMQALARCLEANDAPGALRLVHDLVQSGRDLGRLAGELVDHLRGLLLVAVRAADAEMLGLGAEGWAELQAQAQGLSVARIMGWLKAFMEMQGEARDPARGRLLWEMTLVRLTVPEAESDHEALVRRVERLERALAAGAAVPAPPVAAAERPVVTSSGPALAPAEPSARPVATLAAGPPAAPVADPSAVPGRPTPAAAPPAARPAAPPPVTSGRPAGPPPVSAAPPARPAPTPAEGRAPEVPAPRASARQAPRADLGWGEAPTLAPPRPQQERFPEVRKDSLPEEAPSAVGGAPSPSAAAPADAPVLDSGGGSTPAPPAVPVDIPAREFWQRLLALVREADVRLQAVLREARLESMEGGVLDLVFPANYGWHEGQVQEKRDTVERCAAEILGTRVRIRVRVDGGKAAPSEKEEHDSLVQRASSIFSGRVVEESGG